MSVGAVSKYLAMVRAAGLTWDAAQDLDETALERRIFGEPAPAAPGRFAPLDCAWVHGELKRHRHVTLQLLWEEYRARHGEQAYRYSAFCEHYRAWEKRLKRSMRQRHYAGEKLFIDYAGPTVPVYGMRGDEAYRAHIFVCALGARRLLGLIEPHYPKAGNGTRPKPMQQMLRIYFMQNWFNLSDPQAEDSLYDIESMRRFAGIELMGHEIPDETTILRFRHLLERHQLTEAIFAEIRSLLEEKRLLLKSGTIVDATIIAAPPSTKNEEKARDPEMHQTRKGKDWHFGMKAHIGADRRGAVHSLSTTAANVSDITQMHELLHGDEAEVFGDQAYWSVAHRQAALAKGIRYRINRRSSKLSEHQRWINRRRSAARARVEHVFHVVKNLWGFKKVRYRGLAKNTARLFTAFALANLYLLRRRLLPPQARYA